MRVLADTTAWSLLLRRDAPDSPVAQALHRCIANGTPVFLTGLIYQEVLTGFRDDSRRAVLVRRLSAFELLQPTRQTHEKAARLTDACLRRGVAAKTVDVLIAQLAIERRCQLLTADRDFVDIARCSSLKVFDVTAG